MNKSLKQEIPSPANHSEPPIPKPRHNTGINSSNRVAFGSSATTDLSSTNILADMYPSIRTRSSSLTIHDKRLQTSKTHDNENECCPNNTYYEVSPNLSKTAEPMHSKAVPPRSMPKPILKPVEQAGEAANSTSDSDRF